MAQKIHILRPQSITPIGRYIDHRRGAPGDADVQLAFASVLLYREREYRAFHASSWRPPREESVLALSQGSSHLSVTDGNHGDTEDGKNS